MGVGKASRPKEQHEGHVVGRRDCKAGVGEDVHCEPRGYGVLNSFP